MRNFLNKIGGKTYNFRWSDPMHNTAIKVQIPDFSSLSRSEWADWGPMYQLKLLPHDPVTISYDENSYSLDSHDLAVESPMLAQERATFPLYVRLVDNDKNLKIYLYMTPSAELGKVRIERKTDNVTLLELVLQNRESEVPNGN